MVVAVLVLIITAAFYIFALAAAIVYHTGDIIQGFVSARQVLCHWATSSVIPVVISFCQMFLRQALSKSH